LAADSPDDGNSRRGLGLRIKDSSCVRCANQEPSVRTRAKRQGCGLSCCFFVIPVLCTPIELLCLTLTGCGMHDGIVREDSLYVGNNSIENRHGCALDFLLGISLRCLLQRLNLAWIRPWRCTGSRSTSVWRVAGVPLSQLRWLTRSSPAPHRSLCRVVDSPPRLYPEAQLALC